MYRENFHETFRDLDYIITPKTKSLAKDLERIHEKLKKACSRKAFSEMMDEGEGRHIMVIDPEWLESSLNKGHLLATKNFEIRAPKEVKQELG